MAKLQRHEHILMLFICKPAWPKNHKHEFRNPQISRRIIPSILRL